MEPTVDLRYRRARITVRRTGALTGAGALSKSLDEYEAGRASEKDVARAFVESRIASHSPSFSMDDADLQELISLVTSASDEPPIVAGDPTTLAAALVGARKRAIAKAAPATLEAVPGPASPKLEPRPAAAAATASSSKAERKRALPMRVLLGIWGVIRWLGRGLRRITPKRAIWRVALVLVIAGIVAAAIYANDYLTDEPVRLADEFREQAQPAAEKITDSMDRVYSAYDRYLANSTLPRSEVKNADGVEEIKRRFLPLYDDTEKALKFAEKAIKKARKTIKAEEENLSGVPSKWMLDEKAAIVEAEETVPIGEDYIKRSQGYLRSFEKFVKFEIKALELRRSETESLGGNDVPADATLEEAKAAVAAELAEAKKIREKYLDLNPDPDQEKLYDVYTEQSTIAVDYLEDVLAAYNNLSITAFRAADDEYIEEYKPLRDQASYLIGVFASKSSLQKDSRKIGDLGDDYEEAISEIGTGDGSLVRPDKIRKAAPPPPRPPGGGGSGSDDGDKSVS